MHVLQTAINVYMLLNTFVQLVV